MKTKYIVKPSEDSHLHFSEWDETIAKFVIDDMPGWEQDLYIFDSFWSALDTAKIFDGVVLEWGK